MHVNQRQADLNDALCTLGLQVRPDSALCKSFIAGTTDDSYTAAVVADICAMHKFLYEYTSYAIDCAIQIPYMVDNLSGPLGSATAAMNYIKQHEVPMIKTLAIEKTGGMPTVWPWLLV